MGWTRHTGTVVSLAVLASVVANYAVHRQFERRSQQRVAIAHESAYPGPLILDVPGVEDSSTGGLTPPRSVAPRFLAEMDHSRPLESVTPAFQTSEDTETPAASKGTPSPVPVPNDAVPLNEKDKPANSKTEDVLDAFAVRQVIEDELSGSSREERDIWYEELKSLPAGVVRDLLQVRKQLRSLPRALHKMDPVESVPARRLAALPTEPISQTRRQPLPDWTSTQGALEQACAIARHNIANSTTPGFKRLRVMLVDSYGIHWQDEPAAGANNSRPARLNPIQVEGCRLGESLLDLKQGVLRQTERQLDLAIDGDGLFVAMQDNEAVYTRCGIMVLDAERRLCLAVDIGLAPLEPIITIPADAREIQISANGTVNVLSKLGADPVSVGQLVLARFPSPSRLRPIGGTLLSPTDGSGAAEIGAPDEAGRGVIQQGCLERSNTELELELAEIEQWQTLLKSFPVVGRPVTASGPEPQSR